MAATVSLVAIVATIVVGIKMGFGAQMSVFAAAIVSVIAALLMKAKWADIQKAGMENIANYNMAFVILTMVGILIATWLIGGTLPSLIYYGLELISPRAIVPLAFILCSITSVCTGTSFGCIATMGLALYGIGINLGIPSGVIAGAVVSGAYFGDKMSPMSDTTNLAPAMAETDLYSHIGSMLYTTAPATLVCIVLYYIIGAKYAQDAYDAAAVQLMQETLAANFNIRLVCLVPLIMILVLAILKVPSIMAMGITAVVSVILAMATQGAGLSAIMSAAMNGYVSNTGVAMVDTILTRGGIKSMAGTFALLLFAGFMAGPMSAAGILEAFVAILMKVVKSVRSLVVSTLIFGWGIIVLTGNQMMGIVIPGKAMGKMYDELDVHRKVLSRSLEDSATISAAIVPWSTAAAYIMGVLGVGTEYIPYALLCYVVPVFSILCAFTGFGIWNSKGEKMWKRGK
ncbi:Na+/H+ antiporter NhaC [Dysosmobacter sp.]|uniref:Na+/H+ antiporter NhaC n=1 Tax=Dysosmobacter sp. TaxID=2591382 RepID=UPI002A856D39|nr:Na+/H+ antiporter NhaC [Dysosmobacter sp.]MDY3984288.1 Na+/H+ antiporter NhaC [Dysosmobacter sp.]